MFSGRASLSFEHNEISTDDKPAEGRGAWRPATRSKEATVSVVTPLIDKEDQSQEHTPDQQIYTPTGEARLIAFQRTLTVDDAVAGIEAKTLPLRAKDRS